MSVDHTTPVDEIKVRYVIRHSTDDLERVIRETLAEVAFVSYSIEDITGIFEWETISLDQQGRKTLSVVEIQALNIPYHLIREFENAFLNVEGVLEVCKTYDSFRVEENQEFLAELYNIEMKIREIYTVLARLQGVNLRNSRVRLRREYQDNEEAFKKRAMNEFFFIEFSDYKSVDRRKDTRLEDLVAALGQVRRVKDITDVASEFTRSTLRLEERFNELARVPEAIGRLEEFRNGIAHNRYVSENDVENFRKAKSIIDDVYSHFLARLQKREI